MRRLTFSLILCISIPGFVQPAVAQGPPADRSDVDVRRIVQHEHPLPCSRLLTYIHRIAVLVDEEFLDPVPDPSLQSPRVSYPLIWESPRRVEPKGWLRKNGLIRLDQISDVVRSNLKSACVEAFSQYEIVEPWERHDLEISITKYRPDFLAEGDDSYFWLEIEDLTPQARLRQTLSLNSTFVTDDIDSLLRYISKIANEGLPCRDASHDADLLLPKSLRFPN